MIQFDTLNERFTAIADKVTAAFGTWQVFLFFVFTILLWLAWGPFVHFSDSWQLSINTPTTIIELFQEIFILAATNRVERHNSEQLDKSIALEEKILSLETKIERLLEAQTFKTVKMKRVDL